MLKALSGLKVIDVSRLLTGPFCTMLLADLGADVIKAEVPGRGDDARLFGPFAHGESGYFMTLNRNKRSITLDLRSAQGQAVFKDLIRDADVLLENFTAGTMEEWGIGYDVLREINPRLIYASITGFGHFGPYAQRVAFDAIAQAMGGLMSITGYPDNPPTRVGTSLGDINAGNFTAIGILAALFQRGRTGQGQKIDISMHDCIFAILENAVVRHTIGGQNPTRIGSRHASVAPYDVFEAKDGYVIIACANEATWQRLCQAMGKDELIRDERFLVNDSRTANIKDLSDIIHNWTHSLTLEAILSLLQQYSVPGAPILTIADLADNPHLKARNMLIETQHPVAGKVTIPGNPIKLSASPDTITVPAPLLGQHTTEILSELGYSAGQIEALKAAKVI
jgi:crotonobetainyl-CoA:carnitine CoA-transferase CaiB-like acyl-CoA transferase